MPSPRTLTKFPFRGKGICSWCGKPVKPPRTHWCSQACVEEWQIRANPGHARLRVAERDHGVCSLCGLDCNALARALRATIAEEYRGDNAKRYPGYVPFMPRYAWDAVWDQLRFAERMGTFTRFRSMALEAGIPTSQWRRLLSRHGERDALWEADHIVPVCEGGGACGLDNLRTLCWQCHAGETARLHSRRRALRCAAEVLFKEGA